MTTDVHHTAYPLTWPAGWPRTPAHKRGRPKFDAGGFAVARDWLLGELRLLKASRIILSTNVALRRDNMPLAGQRNPDDPGAAVYFTRQGKPLALACDRWERTEQNLSALARWIEAQRGQERWVGGHMVEAVFTGFQALPRHVGGRPWWEVLGVSPTASQSTIASAYTSLAKLRHPDRGGTHEAMTELNDARDAADKAGGL